MRSVLNAEQFSDAITDMDHAVQVGDSPPFEKKILYLLHISSIMYCSMICAAQLFCKLCAYEKSSVNTPV
jgi:hypothetical protein